MLAVHYLHFDGGTMPHRHIEVPLGRLGTHQGFQLLPEQLLHGRVGADNAPLVEQQKWAPARQQQAIGTRYLRHTRFQFNQVIMQPLQAFKRSGTGRVIGNLFRQPGRQLPFDLLQLLPGIRQARLAFALIVAQAIAQLIQKSECGQAGTGQHQQQQSGGFQPGVGPGRSEPGHALDQHDKEHQYQLYQQQRPEYRPDQARPEIAGAILHGHRAFHAVWRSA